MFNIPVDRNLHEPLPAGVANGVRIVLLPSDGGQKGRGMVATREWKPGEVVVQEPPYAHAVGALEAENVCSSEMREVMSEQGSLCGACRCVRYSSRAAQKRDWAAGHKFECKALQSGKMPMLPDTMVRLAARCLWRRQREEKAKVSQDAPVPFWESFNSVATLLDHLNDGSQALKMTYAALSSQIKYFAQMSGPAGSLGDVNNADVMQLAAKLTANCLNVSLDDGTTMGLGIYPICAMVNHSHTPNVAQIFRKGVLHLRAVRPIASGEEVTITYCGLEQPSFQSRLELQRMFFFDSCPHLPQSDQMPVARTKRLDTTMYAHILTPEVSEKLAANQKDAALCAVARSTQHAHKQFCWVSVCTKHQLDASDMDFKGAQNGPEPGRENKISEATVRAICKQGWQPAHALSLHDQEVATPVWQEQVIEEGWEVQVRLFGDWQECIEDGEDKSWLEVASAAAFGQVGVMWAREMLHTGQAALGRDLMQCVEAAGSAAGLADTHEVMIEARSELMKLCVNESNKLSSVNAAKAKEMMRAAFEYGSKTIEGKQKIYPQAWYDLAATWRTLGDGAVAKDCPSEALQYWEKAYYSLKTLLGNVPEVQRLEGRLRYHRARKGDMKERSEALALMQITGS